MLSGCATTSQRRRLQAGSFTGCVPERRGSRSGRCLGTAIRARQHRARPGKAAADRDERSGRATQVDARRLAEAGLCGGNPGGRNALAQSSGAVTGTATSAGRARKRVSRTPAYRTTGPALPEFIGPSDRALGRRRGYLPEAAWVRSCSPARWKLRDDGFWTSSRVRGMAPWSPPEWPDTLVTSCCLARLGRVDELYVTPTVTGSCWNCAFRRHRRETLGALAASWRMRPDRCTVQFIHWAEPRFGASSRPGPAARRHQGDILSVMSGRREALLGPRRVAGVAPGGPPSPARLQGVPEVPGGAPGLPGRPRSRISPAAWGHAGLGKRPSQRLSPTSCVARRELIARVGRRGDTAEKAARPPVAGRPGIPSTGSALFRGGAADVDARGASVPPTRTARTWRRVLSAIAFPECGRLARDALSGIFTGTSCSRGSRC